MADKTVQIKLPVGVRSWKMRQIGRAMPNWTAQYPASSGYHSHVEANSIVSADDAVDKVRQRIETALAQREPILVYWEDTVALAFYTAAYGWSYRITNKQSTADQASAMNMLGEDSREAVERYMRRHMAGGYIGGLAGAQVIHHDGDRDDYLGSLCWDAGVRAVTHHFKSLDDVPRGEEERARKLGDEYREVYRQYRRDGIEQIAAYERTLDDIDDKCNPAPVVVPVPM